MFQDRFSRLLFLLLGTTLKLPVDVDQQAQPSSTFGQVERFEKDLQGLDLLTVEQAVGNVAGRNGTVILAITSSPYLDFTLNWFTSVSRLGHGSKVLFMAEDKESYLVLRSKWPKQTVFGGKGVKHSGDNTRLSNYKSVYFRSIVDRKPTYISQVLGLNVSVLYNDMDIVWKKDPFEYFKGDYDIWIQEDGQAFHGPDTKPTLLTRKHVYTLCTCFMMIRPTLGAKGVMQRWRDIIEEKSMREGPVHDQPELDRVLKGSRSVTVGVLPVLDFPSGCLFFPGNRNCEAQRKLFIEAKGRDDVAVVHNNWVAGHHRKLNRFKKYGLWFL